MEQTLLRRFERYFRIRKVEIERRLSKLSSELDASQDVSDEADLCANASQQTLWIKLKKREGLYLQKIHQAISRVRNGSFGQCLGCGGDIDERRLRARPTSTLCISCKEEEEKRESTFSNKPRMGIIRRIS